MNDPARLEPLSDYADMRETEAAQRLAASARALKAQEAEVHQLRGYLAAYRQRAELADRTTDAARWQNERAFLTKLS
jgi:flagellar biosynthesis chaperone FliJ